MTMIAIQPGLKLLDPNFRNNPYTVRSENIQLTQSGSDILLSSILSTQWLVKKLSQKLAELNPDNKDLNVTILSTSLALLEVALGDLSTEKGLFITSQPDIDSLPVSFWATSLLFSNQQQWVVSQPVFTQPERLLLHGALHHAELCLLG